MSRLYEALSGLKAEQRPMDAIIPLTAPKPAVVSPAPSPEARPEQHSLKLVQPTVGPLALTPVESTEQTKETKLASPNPVETGATPAVLASVLPQSRLVAWTNPNSLGAEKFRALVTRFDHMRDQRELKSFQVTSSVINEGKTLVSGNIAITLAKYSGSKTLLVEGDLHRPSIAKMFGLGHLSGLNHWWSSGDQDLGKYVRRLNGMPLWFLPAGKPSDQPSDLLRSSRFQKAFAKLASEFEWTVVDSTPMLPVVDVNLWSRLLDGTVLVVREGVTPVKSLKRGLQSLDRPKLIGVVVNEATEFDQVSYEGQYYGVSSDSEKSPVGG
jgi:protein-tyrosine kinase